MTEVMDSITTHQQFIGGSWVDSASGATLDVENPANGRVIARVPASDPEDVDRAARAAAKAFESWQQTTPQDRSLLLLKLADAIEARADEIGRLESANAGKPVGAAIDEVPVVVDNLRFFAGAGRVMEGKAVNEYVAGHTSLIRREPVGVVVSIAPWNYPIMMAGWKIGPALMAGNTVILKPSARTPLTALVLAEIAAEIFPPGVLNVITGTGAAIGDALVAHPLVGMISLTGDTDTGKRIARVAADRVKRLHLELGGKAPVIVFDDADLGAVIENLKVFSYWNAGQDCTAPCRVITGPGVYDRAVADLVGEVRDEPVEDLRPRHDPAGGGAVLAAVPVARPAQVLGDELEVGIVEDDDRGLAAELEVEPLDLLGGDLRDPLAGVGVAGDRDHPDLRVGDEHLADRRAGAADDVEDAGRQDVGDELGEAEGGERRPGRRLEDDRVAGRERRAELPGRHVERVVPRRD